VLVLTIHDDEEYVRPLLQAGVRGYVLKKTFGDDLVQAVRLVSHGEMVLDAGVGDVLQRGLSWFYDEVEIGEEGLTPRQLQLLRWIAQGVSSREMGRRMEVSERTVKTDVSRLLSRLKVHSRSAAVAAAIRDGLLKKEEL
jgi:DNA-binding NarL/FixJ family response regulator